MCVRRTTERDTNFSLLISSTGQTGCPSLMRINKNLLLNVCGGGGVCERRDFTDERGTILRSCLLLRKSLAAI